MLDSHAEILLEQYKSYLSVYTKVKEIAMGQLHKIVDDLGMLVNSVEGRVKTEKSLKGKLLLKGYKYKSIFDITDIVGTRVVTFYGDEVDKIAACVEKLFIIDWDNSIDKRRILNYDQFGYMSLHFICKIPKTLYYDENIPEINEVPFELQVRTVLQHAWATIHHDTGYKNDIEVPRDYMRRLSRLAGILEMVDSEFLSIRQSLDDYRKRVKAVVASGKFDDAELNVDTFNAYVESGAFNELNRRIAEINKMDIVEVSLYSFYPVFKQLGFKTLGDIEKMRTDYIEKAYQFALAQFSGTDIDIISSSVGLNALLIVYIISHGFGDMGLKLYFETTLGHNRNYSSSIKRANETAKKIGIAPTDSNS